MWRRRGSPRPAQLTRQATAATARTAPAPVAETGDPAELLVDHVRWAPVPPGRPVVGIVAGPAEPADAAAGTGAHLVRLVPDRYRAVLGSLDLVVVLASAGSAGAWSGLGGGGAVERDRELGDLLGRCGGQGVASAVLFDVAREQVPVLADLAALADLALGPESSPELTPAARLGDPDGWLTAVLARAAGSATTTKEPDAAT